MPQLMQILSISPLNRHRTHVSSTAKVVVRLRLLQEQISAVRWRREIKGLRTRGTTNQRAMKMIKRPRAPFL